MEFVAVFTSFFESQVRRHFRSLLSIQDGKDIIVGVNHTLTFNRCSKTSSSPTVHLNDKQERYVVENLHKFMEAYGTMLMKDVVIIPTHDRKGLVTLRRQYATILV